MSDDNAAGILWTLAGELETVPALFDDLPDRAKMWMLAWLSTPKDGCPHAAGQVLYSLAGYREAMCADCASFAGLDALVGFCGRCSAPTGDDPTALHAIYAIGPDLIAALSLCGDCMTPDQRNLP